MNKNEDASTPGDDDARYAQFMSRNAVLQQVDGLLERFGPFDNDDALELLREGLNALFRGGDVPWVAFNAIFLNKDGKLTAVVDSLHIEYDIQRWCAELRDYLEGRLLIEPESPIDVTLLNTMRLPGTEE